MSTAFAFDFDGTVTKQELLPAIANSLGLTEEIKILTDLTIQGVLPFETSFRLRFAILKSVNISEVQEAVSKIELDQDIVKFINNNRNKCFIVTGNIPEWISPLTSQLKCKIISSTALVHNNQPVTLSSIINKGTPILSLRKYFQRIVAVGEGANDIPMFDAADIGIAYGGIHKPSDSLTKISDYIVFKSEALCRLLNTLS